MKKTRREMLETLVAIGASLGLVPLAACGDDSGTGTDGGGGGTDGGGRTDAGGRTDGGGGGTDGGGSTDGGGGTTDGGGSTDGGGGDTCTSTIASNHGHVLMVSPADVAAGTDRTYSIMGAAGHTHMVMITAANFATLAGGGTVMVTSTPGGIGAHTHVVTVNCA